MPSTCYVSFPSTVESDILNYGLKNSKTFGFIRASPTILGAKLAYERWRKPAELEQLRIAEVDVTHRPEIRVSPYRGGGMRIDGGPYGGVPRSCIRVVDGVHGKCMNEERQFVDVPEGVVYFAVKSEAEKQQVLVLNLRIGIDSE